jgi:predicted metalloprotease
MRWRGRRQSQNVEDRRGARLGRPAGGLRLGGGGILVLLLGAWLLGINPLQILGLLAGGAGAVLEGAPPEAAPVPSAASDAQAEFVSVVLADTEDTWSALFSEAGARYVPPKLVLFSGVVRSACGTAQAAMGPFYCPGDQKVYIDLDFYRDLRERFGAPGDFAQAYVIAHEVGHHVQTLQGVSQQVHEQQQRLPEAESNALSVRLELQADCYAGVWAHQANRLRQLLEQGDVEEGLAAAAAIGDDRLQQQTQGRVVPESFTHGTSRQRVAWFRRGLDSGSLASCDTFTPARL